MIASSAQSLQTAIDAYDKFCAWCFGFGDRTPADVSPPGASGNDVVTLAAYRADRLCSTCEITLARDFMQRRAMRPTLEPHKDANCGPADVVPIYRTRNRSS